LHAGACRGEEPDADHSCDDGDGRHDARPVRRLVSENTGTPSSAEITREAMTVSRPPWLPRQVGIAAASVMTL
jgi:hypothetical protein